MFPSLQDENNEDQTSDVEKIQSYLNGSEAIKDISPQFVENVNIILEKYENNTFVTLYMIGIVSEKYFENDNYCNHREK